jgi:hypothetical protein
MDDKNDIQEPADSFGSVMTKAEDKVVTDGMTTVKSVPNQQIQKRYMNSKLDYPILIAGFSGPGMVGMRLLYLQNKIDEVARQFHKGIMQDGKIFPNGHHVNLYYQDA